MPKVLRFGKKFSLEKTEEFIFKRFFLHLQLRFACGLHTLKKVFMKSRSLRKNLHFTYRRNVRKTSRKLGFFRRGPGRFMKLDWRIVWYSVVVWILGIIIGGFVLLPWFYLALPITIFGLTFFYFRNSEKTLKMGLWVSLFWFLIVAILDFLEIIGPYYFRVSFYFSDFRNWLKYPLILLIPVVYSLILEAANPKKQNLRGKQTLLPISKPLSSFVRL